MVIDNNADILLFMCYTYMSKYTQAYVHQHLISNTLYKRGLHFNFIFLNST